MKKLLIAAVVGGILLWFWQFLSWTVLQMHAGTQQYTPKQAEILEFLDQNLEEGFYFLPLAAPGEDEQAVMEANAGKPWAQVYFHKSLNNAMGINMVRGLVANILAILLLSWILMKMGNASFRTMILSSIFVGVMGYLSIVYAESIWYEIPSLMDLIDGVIGWALVGAWLGWWLRRP